MPRSLLPLLALLAIACDGKSDDSADAPEDFNYIPTYSNACLPTSLDQQDAARGLVDAHIQQSDFLVGAHFSLCDESSCAPCTEDTNTLLKATREVEGWASDEALGYLAQLGGDDVGLSLEAYFDAALDYAWRYLLFSTPQGAEGATALTLSQGIRLDCAGGGTDCWDFNVAHESLESTCQAFGNDMDVTVSTDGASRAVTTTAPDDAPFGFAVPITDTLPDPASFASVEELQAFVASLSSFAVELEAPTVELTFDDDTGQGCATIHGQTPDDAMAEIAASGTSLDPYATDGGIDTVLSLQLVNPNVHTWSNP